MSLIRGEQITGSVASASYAVTASYIILAQTASYVENAETASYAPAYTLTASFNEFTSSYQNDSSSFNSSISSLTNATSSYVLNSQTSSMTVLSSSYALTASYAPDYLPLTGGTINGDVTVNGTASIAFLNVTYESSSVIYSSGSNQFGDETTDTQTLIGIVIVSGSLEVTGSTNIPNITGSLLGTASYALQALSSSYAVSSSHALFADTASNILGGKATHIPFFITDTSLATSSMYQSGSSTIIINQDNATTANPEALYVWQPSVTSFNVISGKGNLNNYLQLNIQNTNQGSSASSDVVATANNGSETDNYIDMGINNENFSGFLGGPNDAYLYTHGHDFWIGNINDGYNIYVFNSSSNQPIVTITPSNDVQITGSLNVTENVVASSFTGSLLGTASYALQALSSSYALTASYAANVPATASYAIQALSSSYAVTSSYSQTSQTASYVLNAVSSSFASTASYVETAQTASYVLNAVSSSYALTASYAQTSQTSSYVLNAVSASYATTASYVNGMVTKDGAVTGGSFAGNPKKYTVTFATPFTNTNYSITVTGEDQRVWTIESKLSGSFTINANSNVALAGNTYWQAIKYGEFVS